MSFHPCTAGLLALLIRLAAPAPALAEPAAFVHPGILNSRFELEHMKAKVAAGEQPWKGAFDRMRALSMASLGYAPKPRAQVDCGSGSNPDLGCSDEKRDSQAAYLHALLWAVTGDPAHARKAAEILDAWKILQGHGLSNAMLEAGWTGGPFLRAAEILKHTWNGWPQADQDAFRAMIDRAFLPLVVNGRQPGTNGNWEAVMIETLLSIAVFEDDRALFDKGVALYRKRLPAYIYAKSDGPMPRTVNDAYFGTSSKIITHWHGQSVFMDGLSQETCRDLPHTEWGIAGLVHSAEIAWKQGLDLYAAEDNRLLLGLEFHAPLVAGQPAPSNLCGGRVKGGYVPMWEMGLNHYVNWKGLAAPHSDALAKARRPEVGPDHAVGFETLTHFGMGNRASGQPFPQLAIAVRRAPRANRLAAFFPLPPGATGWDLQGRLQTGRHSPPTWPAPAWISTSPTR
jgi:hypothetical protein